MLIQAAPELMKDNTLGECLDQGLCALCVLLLDSSYSRICPLPQATNL